MCMTIALAVLVGVWVLAVVGTALLRVSMAARFARYSEVPSMVALERGPYAACKRVGEAVASPGLWAAGLLHALGLLVGHDSAAAIDEKDVERAAELADREIRAASERSLAELEARRRGEQCARERVLGARVDRDANEEEDEP